MQYPVRKVNLSAFRGAINTDASFKLQKLPSKELISSIYSRFLPYAESMTGLYNRYSASYGNNIANTIPIFDRELSNPDKINNKIASNFFRKIVNAKVGYYASNISYSVDSTDKENYDTDQLNEKLNDFLTITSMAKINADVATNAGICGYGVKYLYIKDGQILCESVNPSECVFIGDYCFRFYQNIKITANADIIVYVCEFYDETNITRFESESDAVGWQVIETKPHFLSVMPMIKYRNNSEENPDCDNAVFSTIDTYDICNSDMANVITQIGNAILVLSNGSGLPAEGTAERAAFIKALKDISILDLKEGTAEYLIKNVNDTFFQNMLNRWERDIYAFADSVNMNDTNFASASGVAMKYKMFALEQASMKSEREFMHSELKLLKAVCDFWNVSGGHGFEYWDIKMTFSRNFPLDLLSEAQTLAMLKGNISDETALSQMTFISDPKKEIEKMKIEQDGMIDLDSVPEEPQIDETMNAVNEPANGETI